jgi:ABC-type lipoprotein release transport system permease subunit
MFIMTLTFLNLVVISGILVGLIEGGNIANRKQYTGDVIITKRAGEPSIERTPELLATLENMPAVERYSARYLKGGSIEANYKTRKDFNALPDTVGAQIAGINIAKEDALSGISDYVVEGRFLDPDSTGEVVIGANMLRRFSSAFGDGFDSLDGVYPGDTVKITVEDRTKEFRVVGIVKSKVGEVSFRTYMNMNDYRTLANSTDLNASEIAIVHNGIISDEVLKNMLVSEFGAGAKIQTATEAIPQFLNDIRTAFSLLGNVIGGIGIIVASVTMFIVIFINAITRRKYIGILKGIGVSGRAIQGAYILQSLFFALSGAIIGTIIIYGLLVPAFAANPLDFPFSDGILVATASGTTTRAVLLLCITLIAGYIPARMIVRKNTLDSILGR